MQKPGHPAGKSVQALAGLVGGEAAAGVLLIAVALAALIVANSPLASAYHHAFHGRLVWTPLPRLDTMHAWINDAAMAVFFFVVGLEIKREMLEGELSSAAKRRLPVLAAAAGMAAPALIYLGVAGTAPPPQRGWAVPAATDIAFAMGVIGLLGQRVPPTLRLFLLTVAIIDDLGAVAVIAVFYTAKIAPLWLISAMVIVATLAGLGRSKTPRYLSTLLLACALWYCMLNSGIHATIAGVIAAFTIPLRATHAGESMLLRLEHALTPWSAFLIVPLFGFANAGVSLDGLGLDALLDPVPLGIAAGLFLGKQLGIVLAILVANRTGFARPPQGATWMQLWGMAVLCGIGFTMSLFVAALAFPAHPHLAEEAKLGIIAGSLLSSLLGFAILRLAPMPRG
ncbi:MAG TPA: Na+/H+ antiporter NhaA [Novosphingobium sp.]|nr:Na+/H+ antiporter NhaA [Novosphingobium sp.]